MNVFFDVQGTLVSGGVPRPHAREVLQEISALGHAVYLWSSAGERYAARAAELLGVEDVILGCCSKSAPLAPVDFAVDDYPEPVEYYGGYRIAPFLDDPEDRELWKVLEAIK